jgi:trans-aconitate 2-methyltransferase
MLAKAKSEPSRVQWIEADIHTWFSEQPPDLIYSNATLHWIDNHRELFPKLLRSLSDGGCLAVQMPLSWSAPSHVLMRETLENGGPNGGSIGPLDLREAMSRNWVEDPATYYDLLANRARSIDIWETEYMHVLDGDEPVLAWVSGTGLRPILNALDDNDRTVFLDSYSRRVREAYPTRPDGKTLFPFRRLFIIAAV